MTYEHPAQKWIRLKQKYPHQVRISRYGEKVANKRAPRLSGLIPSDMFVTYIERRLKDGDTTRIFAFRRQHDLDQFVNRWKIDGKGKNVHSDHVPDS